MTVGTYQARQLQVDGQRLNRTLHETCKWGAAHRWGPKETETGMCRLSLSDDDKKVRDWFVAEMEAIGCKVTIDTMGNLFAVRPGKKEGPPTAMGSHLDTQPTGGRYDGILGVMSAIEAMRTIHDAGYITEYPVAVIDWTNEEGARFPKSIHGSAVWSAQLGLEEAHAMEDVSHPGIKAGDELERIGYDGKHPCSHIDMPLGAHFEIHIEQGPILEVENKRIGVVQGAHAFKWLKCHVYGRDSHAGTTPMDYRADATQGLARILIICSEVAKKYKGVATNGLIHCVPGSFNTIAKEVEISLDMRHFSDEVLNQMLQEMKDRAEAEIVKAAPNPRNQLQVKWEMIFESAAAIFHPDCKSAVKEAALANLPAEEVRDIVSGAGHDSCATSLHVPTGMIFVPCKDGLSHNPEEYTKPEDCALGAQVLLDSVLLYDSRRVK